MKKTSQNKKKEDVQKAAPEDKLPSNEILNPNENRERLHVDMEDLTTSRTTPEDLKNESTEPEPQLKESNLTRDTSGQRKPGTTGDKSDDQPWPLDFEARDEDSPRGETNKNGHNEPGK